jgi:Fe-S-cluster-containing hydrogenase component 2
LSTTSIKISINPDLCSGCHLCELACSTYHFKKSSIELSRIIIYKDKAKIRIAPMLCISCPAMPCAKACPTNAIVVDDHTGMPKVLTEKCTSCGDCAKACPFNAIRFEYSVYAYPLICDLCGGTPQCVEVCPTGALSISTPSERFKGAAKASTVIKEITSKS